MTKIKILKCLHLLLCFFGFSYYFRELCLTMGDIQTDLELFTPEQVEFPQVSLCFNVFENSIDSKLRESDALLHSIKLSFVNDANNFSFYPQHVHWVCKYDECCSLYSHYIHPTDSVLQVNIESFRYWNVSIHFLYFHLLICMKLT